MKGQLTRAGAVAVAVLVVLSGLPAGIVGTAAGGTPTVPSDSPALNVTAETRTVGATSNVSVAYNLTHEIDAADVSLQLSNGTDVYGQVSPGATEGTENLTVPASVPGGDHRVRVSAFNTSSGGAPNASTMTVVRTDSPVIVETYDLSTTTPALDENVTVNATLNNTAATAANFSVRVYDSDVGVAAANETVVSLSGTETRHVELNVSYDFEGTYNLTVNDEPTTAVDVGDGDSVGGFTETSVSAGNATLPVGEAGAFDVTYDLGDDVEAADAKLEVSNHTATLDTNSSLVDNDTVQLSLPARSTAGDERLQVAVRNGSSGYVVAESVLNLSVRGNVTVESVTPPATAVASAGENVSVTLNNTGPDAETFRISLYDDGTSRFSAGSKHVSVPANTESTYDVSTSYARGERTTYLGNESHGTTTVFPAATVESVTHLSGPENASALDSSVSSGGMLTVELRNGTDQDLAPAGVTEDSRFEVVVHVNHSVDPGLVVANARNVSWSVENTTDHYVVTVEAQPLESQFMSNAPSLDDWDSLSDSEDRADDKLLWYSVSFLDEDSLYNENMTNMTVATDAQTFGTPRYDAANDSVDIELAAPHYTVSGVQNNGTYQATIPSAMLDQWGISSADELTGTYEGESRSITTTSNADGSVDVAMDVHYSSGEVSLRPDTSSDDDGSSGGGSSGGGGSSDSDDDDDDSADGSTDDTATNATDDAANESDRLPELNGTVKTVDAVLNADGSSSAVVENVSANETVRIRLPNASAANAGNASVGDDAAANDSGGNVSDAPAVNGLDLNLRNDTDSLGVDVSASEAVPEGTPALASASEESASVGYLSIDVEGTTDDDIENATVAFSVPAERLAAANASPENVTLHRYHDGEWQTLETDHLGGDRYAAETPGFSVFAVSTAEEVPDAANETPTPSPTETTLTETTTDESTATRPTETGTEVPTPTAATETSTGVPGFGVVAALASLLAVALVARRRA